MKKFVKKKNIKISCNDKLIVEIVNDDRQLSFEIKRRRYRRFLFRSENWKIHDDDDEKINIKKHDTIDDDEINKWEKKMKKSKQISMLFTS